MVDQKLLLFQIKSAETVVILVLDEIIPRHSTSLQIVTNNGTKTSTG